VAVIENKQLIFFFCCVVAAALIFSPFLLSVGMFAIATLSVLKIQVGPKKLFVGLERDILKRLFAVVHHPSFAAVTFFFFIVFIGPWPAEDYSFWFERMRIKAPFLGLTLVFLLIPVFDSRQVAGLFYVLLIILLLSSIGIGVNYLLNFEEINELLKKGQPMPTPRNHIRFSQLMALGILGGGWLVWKKYYWKNPFEKKLILFITVFLFLFIHMLSVRSGLVALYSAVAVLTLQYIYLHKKFLAGAGIFVVLISMPVLAYQLIPSFRSKIAYMRYDFLMYQRGEGGLYADSGRIVSLKVGLHLAGEHPVWGVGPGNLRREVAAVYKENYPGYDQPLTPHNQFLYVLAGSGAVGLSVFLAAFFVPLFYRRNYRHPLLLGFYVLVFTSFLLEHTIENSIGVGFFSFFLLLLLNHLNREN
jgi:O-antigen ligase